MLIPVCLFAAATAQANPALTGPVRVEILENVPAKDPLDLSAASVTEIYQEPAFAFVRTPVKFSPNAFALDRSSPFVLRATYERSLPGGAYRFRMRARGLAVLSIDGKEVARSKAQPANTSGDDPVPPPPVRLEGNLRPAPYPHQDVLHSAELAAGRHTFVLTAVIGGKGLYPSPGELAVSLSRGEVLERLLGPDDAPFLTDSDWERLAAAMEARHRAADVTRRRETGKEVAAAWKARHEQVRTTLAAQPGPVAPSTQAPVWNAIDRFVGARLDAEKLTPTGLTSDLEFLRRLTLDTTGLIPTPAEVRGFLADAPAKRRGNAIARLLKSDSWADHWVSYWQDVLAENPGILKPDLNNTGPFRWWMHQSFTDGIPFDRFAAELVSMDGSLHQGAPAAFAQSTLNDSPMAAKADILAQAFLGQRMACARCHDAPFHPFRQKDLFSLAGMLAGKDLSVTKTSTVPMTEGARKPAVNVTLKPGEPVAQAWPFPSLASHADPNLPSKASLLSRAQVAALIIAPENTRFAQVIVNRVWKRYLGTGIVEPADDWSRAKPSNAELLNYLAREFAMNGYDLKHLARMIFESHAYQRKPVEDPAAEMGKPVKYFAGPARRKMTAEQLVDSLHASVGKDLNVEEMNLNPVGDRPPTQFLNMGKPERSWQMTALSNERDRPALALPIAQSVSDVLTTYGWRQSRQNAVTSRDDAASPMQTLILANGILGTRIARLSDDSYFTGLLLKDMPLSSVINEMFLRLLSRPASAEETRIFTALLKDGYAGRRVAGAASVDNVRKSDTRVSWSNHLSAEATLIRMEEEKKLRMGDQPTARLAAQFREKFEDALWSVVNSPEFVVIP
ncbi:MAG: DUF1553 domain-containing protein [Acidobacteria bacterium]|nr:DUF1553 domain-containing protein [Acidobacteriota bacterium]